MIVSRFPLQSLAHTLQFPLGLLVAQRRRRPQPPTRFHPAPVSARCTAVAAALPVFGHALAALKHQGKMIPDYGVDSQQRTESRSRTIEQLVNKKQTKQAGIDYASAQLFLTALQHGPSLQLWCTALRPCSTRHVL